MGIIDSENIGIAFGAVCAAGASTAVGASVVFFPRLVKLASRRVLAASLGFAAGVMCYVSFVEIFQKSVGAFTDHATKSGFGEEKAGSRGYVFGTLSFFGGVLLMIVSSHKFDLRFECVVILFLLHMPRFVIPGS